MGIAVTAVIKLGALGIVDFKGFKVNFRQIRSTRGQWHVVTILEGGVQKLRDVLIWVCHLRPDKQIGVKPKGIAQQFADGLHLKWGFQRRLAAKLDQAVQLISALITNVVGRTVPNV